MSQQPTDAHYGFQDEPTPPAPPAGKPRGKALSESEVKKALARKFLDDSRKAKREARRQAERDSAPGPRAGASWVVNGPLIAALLNVGIGLAGLGVCALLGLVLPFYIVPGLWTLIALVGVVYVWFGLNE